MRRLNYDIQIGYRFYLPSLSWQVGRFKGNYEVVEKTDEYYICVSTEKATAPKMYIPPICLAFILGEEEEGKPNVIYSGEDCQPTGLDDFHYANDDGEFDGDFPFFYCGWIGEDRVIHCDMHLGRWCYFSLPWE